MSKRDRKAEIMQAAEKLFTSRRYGEITVDDIIAQAGVGKGTVYRYFQDKGDLFFQTATRGFDELCELIASRVPEDGPFEPRLLAACEQISGFFRHRRPLLRMMFSDEARLVANGRSYRRKWRDKRARLREAVAAILAGGAAEGRIRADVPPEVLAGFLMAMLRTRAREMRDFPRDNRSLELVVELFCRGAGVSPAARGDA